MQSAVAPDYASCKGCRTHRVTFSTDRSPTARSPGSSFLARIGGFVLWLLGPVRPVAKTERLDQIGRASPCRETPRSPQIALLRKTKLSLFWGKFVSRLASVTFCPLIAKTTWSIADGSCRYFVSYLGSVALQLQSTTDYLIWSVCKRLPRR